MASHHVVRYRLLVHLDNLFIGIWSQISYIKVWIESRVFMRLLILVYAKIIISCSDDDDDDEDDTEALLAELEQIKEERAEEKLRKVMPFDVHPP